MGKIDEPDFLINEVGEHFYESNGEDPDDPGTDALRDHPKGQLCMKRAEKVEAEIGLFDAENLDTHHHRMIAEKMRDQMSELFGNKMEDFADKLHKRLTESRKAGDSFGAEDACMFALELYGEL